MCVTRCLRVSCSRYLGLVGIQWKVWLIVNELDDLVTGVQGKKETLNKVPVLAGTFTSACLLLLRCVLPLILTLQHPFHFRSIVSQCLLDLLSCCEAHYLDLSNLLLLVELDSFNV